MTFRGFPSPRVRSFSTFTFCRTPGYGETAAVQVGGDPEKPVGRCVYQEGGHYLLMAEGGLSLDGIEHPVWRLLDRRL
jgi:hypothetical protein